MLGKDKMMKKNFVQLSNKKLYKSVKSLSWEELSQKKRKLLGDKFKRARVYN